MLTAGSIMSYRMVSGALRPSGLRTEAGRSFTYLANMLRQLSDEITREYGVEDELTAAEVDQPDSALNFLS